MQTRYYRSKIGRLPWSVRNELNERIRDGAVGAAVLSWLNNSPEMSAVRAATGCGDISPQNLTDWRGTGYKDWLAGQDKTERLRSLASLSEQIAAQTGGDPAAVGSRILAGRLLDALESATADGQDALVKAFVSLRCAENDAARVALASDRQRLDEKRLALEQDKFRRTLCEAFLKLVENDRAMDIANGKGSNSQKIQALLEFMDQEQRKT
jgi:hypothetical protein